MNRPAFPQPVRILESVWEASGVQRLRLNRPENWANHQPGQYVMLTVFGVGEIPLSVSSPPAQDDCLEVCARQVGEVTSRLLQLSPGSLVGLRGPLGHGFPLDQFRGKSTVVIAGGMGIVPIRSLVEELLADERSDECSLNVYLGIHHEENLVYKSRMAMWEQCGARVRIAAEQPGPSWSGAVGRVTDLLGEEVRNARVAIVGPPPMYLPTIRQLLQRDVAAEHIWVSLERRMACGIGKCGHCQAGGLCVCQQGPVFCYADIAGIKEAW